MKPVRLKIRQKFTILLAVSISFTLAVFFLFLAPNMRATEKLYLDFEAKKDEVTDLLAADVSPQVLAGQIRIVKLKLGDMDGIFLYPDSEIDFIRFLEDTAEEHSIQQKITLGEPGSGQSKMAVSLNLQGQFEDFLAYLIDLETSDYYINILSFRVNSDGRPKTVIIPEPSDDGEIAEPIVRGPVLSVSLQAKVFMKQ